MGINIGNTPLIKIKYKYNGKENYIYTKLEFYNLTGSIKDRVAYYIIKEAYKTGKLKKRMEIVEATSGNVGISLSFIGKQLGYKVMIVMPNNMSLERVNLSINQLCFFVLVILFVIFLVMFGIRNKVKGIDVLERG